MYNTIDDAIQYVLLKSTQHWTLRGRIYIDISTTHMMVQFWDEVAQRPYT